MSNPTIVVANLDDAKLKASIDEMVKNLDKGLNEMIENTNDAEKKMQASLQSVGNVKFGGENDGGSTRRTKKQQEEADAVKQTANAYDQLAQSQQKSTQVKSARESYYAFVQGYKEQARKLESLIKAEDNRLASIGLGGFSTETRSQLAQVDASIDQTRWKINFLYQEEKRLNQEALRQKVGSAGFEQAWLKKDETKSARVREGERLIELEKERQRIIASDPSVQHLDKNIEQTRTKIQQLLADEKRLQSESLKQAVGSSEFERLWNQKYAVRDERIANEEKLIQLEKERQSLVAVDPIRTQLTNMDELRAKHEKVLGVMRDETTTNNRDKEAIRQQTSELDKQLQKVKEINSSKSAKAAYESVSAMPSNTIDQITLKLQALQALKEKVANTPLLSKASQSRLTQAIADTKTRFEQLENSLRGTNQSKKSLDEMNAYIRQNIQREQERRDAIRQTGLAARETADQIMKSAHEQAAAQGNNPITGVKELTAAIEQMRIAYFDMSASEKNSPIGLALEADIKRANEAITVIRKYNQSLLGAERNDANKITNASTLNSLRESLKNLTEQYNRLTVAELNAGKGDALIQHFQDTTRAAQILQRTLNRPVNLKAALSGDERTLDDIAYKMQRLRSYRQGIDLTKPNAANEIKQVDEALAKLQKDANKWMSKSQEMLAANNALARSFNYMKNRLAFYFTVGASTQFVKSLIDIRSQYEMNERALGILINSAERGTQIFKELSEMALVSPYTLIELSSAAKQLVAYDVAARDVVDTTRRLADMASAVGVPMERLTYALGQIKAYGYLNSRDARMFANAGIPLVKQLADYYTQLEGKMVSTAEVYDRMKKKAIDYNDVMAVVTKMTDDGGKFFNFQAKMADTLKVRLANLTLAWNNMMNEIGASKQGLLTGTIGALKEIFLRWKDINSIINSLIKTFGLFKAIQFSVLLFSGKLATAAGWQILLGKKLQTILWGLTQSLWKLVTTPLTWWALLAVAVGSAVNAYSEANEAVVNFNKAIRDGAEDNYNNISKFLEQYKQLRNSLYTKKDGKIVPVDIDKNEAKQAWEAVREEIELTSKNAETYIGQLLSISNMSERVREGFNILDNINTVNAALKELDDNSIKIEQDYSQWWNLWMLPDGLIGNLNELVEAEKELVDVYGSVEAAKRGGGQLYTDYEKRELANFRKDLKVTTDSILDFISLKGWAGDTEKINEVFKQITDKIIIDNQLDPQKAFTLQLEVEEARSKAAKNALAQRINDEAAAYRAAQDANSRIAIKARYDALREEYATFENFNGKTRVYWTDFTKWLKEQHISETREMFKGMDAAQIQSINFQEGKYKEWVTRMVERYAKEHKMSYDSAFSYLKNWVTNANKWSIFIPLTISTEEKKSIYETLTEADTAIDTAYKKIQRLKQRQEELNKKGGLVSDDDKVKEDSEKIIEEIAAATKDYNEALEKGGHSKKENAAATKAQKQAESELQKALKDELQLIEKVRSAYKELTKAGVTHAEAIELAVSGYGKSVANINNVLKKYGLELDLTKFAGTNNPHEMLTMLQKQLNTLIGKAKPAEIQALEVEVQKIKLDVDKFDATQVTEGLNRELGKIKDEYELALELDANPELGSMFAEMFGIDTDALPQTFAEAFDKANKVAMEKLQELKVNIGSFDLMSTVIKPDEEGKWMGLAYDSTAVQELVKAQKEWRDLYRKNLESTEKMLDDYVKKYGDYSDKMAEIEAKRLAQMKELNNAYYTEEMKNSQEYKAKANAINTGAEHDKGQAKWEEFKNSTLYVTMFENLEYASTKTLEAIHQKLEELKGDWKQLTPEQLKTITDQYLKIENQLSKRNPFKGLVKNAKEYSKAVGASGKKAQENLKKVQSEYDASEKLLTTLKSEAKQMEANNMTKNIAYKILMMTISAEEEKAKKLKEELKKASELVQKYDLMRKIFKQHALAVGETVKKIGDNLQGLAQFRDTLNSLFGIDASKGETLLGHNIDGMIDGLAKTGQAMSQIVDSATSGNVFGVVGGVVNVFAGIGDSIASIFGGGSAKTKKLNEEINKSVERVHKLSLAYKDLERAVEVGMGSTELQARRQEMVNKAAQLRELQRQKQLESEKRSKDRDDDRIKDLESSIKDLQIELKEMADEIAATLLGSKVKDAAEEFVSTWVDAWRAGEDTMAAMDSKFDDMIDNMIMKSVASRVVANRLQKIWDTVDAITSEDSEGGVSVTMNELQRIKDLIGDKSISEAINDDLKALYGALGIAYGSNAEKSLSALQQGLQGMSEDTAGALEAYMNGVSQQVYLQNDLLTQIRDVILGFDIDIQTATLGQILLQLQNSYQVQMSIQNMLEGALNPSGRAFMVELNS